MFSHDRQSSDLQCSHGGASQRGGLATVTAAVVLLLACAAASAGDQVVVLLDHRFGEEAHPSTSVRLEQFDGHLEHLERNGYAVVPLTQGAAAVRDGAELPDRAVAITMDDAYHSVYAHAFPRLRARGYPFTVFVATGPIDSGRPGYMTWDQMREMEREGASFASHGSMHLSFVRRPGVASEIDLRVRVRADIEHSARRLSEELHPLADVLAYPYGEYDSSVAELVVEMGYVAFGQHSGVVGRADDLRCLPRFPMSEAFAGVDDFALKVATRPFPVARIVPWDPTTTSRRPRLEVELGETDARFDHLACFVGGQGEVPVEWLDYGRRFAVAPSLDLAEGRNRVNCTAPSADGNRFHWFGHPWIVRRTSGP